MHHSTDSEKRIYTAILEACRGVRELFGEEQAAPAPDENQPDLALYRQSLGAGLDRLQGKWKETLGASEND